MWGGASEEKFTLMILFLCLNKFTEKHLGKSMWVKLLWQSQYWNPLLPGSQSTIPTTHSKLARALHPGNPWVAVAYTPLHLVPSQLMQGSFIVYFPDLQERFFLLSSFSQSGKTVLANFLTESSDITEYNPTQGVRWALKYLCPRETLSITHPLYLGCWWHSKSIIFPK